jgi:inhibitor of cysteine peptidase
MKQYSLLGYAVMGVIISTIIGVAMALFPKPEQRIPHARSLILVTQENDGQTVVVTHPGGIAIWLDAQPSTGYSWVPSSNLGNLSLLDSQFLPINAPEVVGAPCLQKLTFGTSGPGTSDLNLEYRRPFEKDVPAKKTFTLHVAVEEARWSN